MGMIFDISNAKADVREFPHGWYEAVVKDMEEAVSKNGNNMLVINLDLHSPTLGKASIRDWVVDTESWASKSRNLFLALTRQQPEDLAGVREIEVDPRDFIGASLLVKIGGQKDSEWPALTAPWYMPDDRIDLLEGQEDEGSPF